jgi:hypothetical protein
MATGPLRGPRFTPCRPAFLMTGPSLKPRVACCLRPCQRIWRAGSPTRPSAGFPCPHPGVLRLEAARSGVSHPTLWVYVGSHRPALPASAFPAHRRRPTSGRLRPPPPGVSSGSSRSKTGELPCRGEARRRPSGGRWLPTYTQKVGGSVSPFGEPPVAVRPGAGKGNPQRAVSEAPHARFSGGAGDSKRPEAGNLVQSQVSPADRE